MSATVLGGLLRWQLDLHPQVRTRTQWSVGCPSHQQKSNVVGCALLYELMRYCKELFAGSWSIDVAFASPKHRPPSRLADRGAMFR